MGDLETCSICSITEWLSQNILTILFKFTLYFFIPFLLGRYLFPSAPKKTYQDGLVEGILHYMRIKSYDAADFSDKYKPDLNDALSKAREKYKKEITPKHP